MRNSFTRMQILNQEIKVMKAAPKFMKNYRTIWNPQKWITLFFSKNIVWWSLRFYRGKRMLWEVGGIGTMSMWVRFALRAGSEAQSVPQSEVCASPETEKMQNPEPNLQNQSLCGGSTGIFFKNKFISLFVCFFYFWLCWVIVAARGLSLVAESGGYSSLWCAGFSLRGFSCCRAGTGSRRAAFSSCSTQAQ